MFNVIFNRKNVKKCTQDIFKINMLLLFIYVLLLYWTLITCLVVGLFASALWSRRQQQL